MELPPDRIKILIVNEDPQVVETLGACFPSSRYHCETATKAIVALELLKRTHFNVVLCNADAPSIDAIGLLRRGLARNPHIAFLMLTATPDSRVAVESLVLGAFECVRKPFGGEDLVAAVERVFESQRAKILQELSCALHEKTLHQRTAHLHAALLQLGEVHSSTLEVMAAALDSREKSANLHSLRVQRYAILLAQKCGYRTAYLKKMAYGALLHDIGKIAIPESILFKAGKLTTEEYQIVQHHAMFGYQVLSRIPHFEQAAVVALMHHEWFDGNGYPLRLKGDAIPLEARIFAVADTLDAMTSARPYRPARSMATARTEILRCAGTQFDKDIVDIYMGTSDEEWMAAREEVTKRSEAILCLLPQMEDAHAVRF